MEFINYWSNVCITRIMQQIPPSGKGRNHPHCSEYRRETNHALAYRGLQNPGNNLH